MTKNNIILIFLLKQRMVVVEWYRTQVKRNTKTAQGSFKEKISNAKNKDNKLLIEFGCSYFY
jgi:hypothetical protein